MSQNQRLYGWRSQAEVQSVRTKLTTHGSLSVLTRAWSVEVVCMDELPNLVTAAQHGDIDAFAERVRRYQDLAFAAAYALARLCRTSRIHLENRCYQVSRLVRGGILATALHRAANVIEAAGLLWTRRESRARDLTFGGA
jgi:hypothetical protein